ncbi:MAG: S24/S26 family peptidase [Bacteroides sp.]|nr:S24/S26 family peptidase [Eubacterium sp.]MCM1417580.1 S24/S26 family peptidase [Roseburia sp.]MCM1461709.1 S24/S26 family peptidase [Bacteroides sp.]
MKTNETSIADELNAGRAVTTPTHGISMKPLLTEGKTLVLVEPLDRPLTVGELPIFLREDGKYVIHRVIGADAENYYTRGDNCLNYETVPKGQMLGVVTEIYRGEKTLRVTDRRYRLYVAVWRTLTPLRLGWKRLRVRLSQAKKRILKK